MFTLIESELMKLQPNLQCRKWVRKSRPKAVLNDDWLIVMLCYVHNTPPGMESEPKKDAHSQEHSRRTNEKEAQLQEHSSIIRLLRNLKAMKRK
jgi:hypothetical protein